MKPSPKSPAKSVKAWARCSWRKCFLKAAELDLAPEFPFCKYHRSCVEWIRLLEDVGANVNEQTPPFQLPLLFLAHMRENASTPENKAFFDQVNVGVRGYTLIAPIPVTVSLPPLP